MDKEDIKELARQSMLETIKNNLDSTMIFMYIKSLEDRIDKVIEYIEENCMFHNENNEECYFNYGDVLSPKKLVDILKGSEE